MRIALPGWGHVWPGEAAIAPLPDDDPLAGFDAASRCWAFLRRFRRPTGGGPVNGRRLLLALGGWLLLALPAGAAALPAGRLIPEPIFGGQCYLVELGREHPERLLLIHGVGDEAGRSWDALLPELARRYHVLVPDLPGFGRSTRANRLDSPENYAAFIDWLLRREPDQPTIVVGHSLGGSVALVYAGRYGQNLAGLVLVDAVGVLHRVTISEDFVQQHLHFDGPFFPEEAQGFFQRLAGRLVEKFSPPRDNFDRVLASEELRATTLDGAPERIAGLALVQTDFTPFLAGLRTPTWLLWGRTTRSRHGAWRCCCRDCCPVPSCNSSPDSAIRR